MIGVATGTAVSCLFRTIRYYIFFNRHILFLDATKVFKRVGVAIGSAGICMMVFYFLNFQPTTFTDWLWQGVTYVMLATLIVVPINVALFFSDFQFLLRKLKNSLNTF